jgi:anti-sigma factor RsiW
MNPCRRVAPLLDPFVDGELAPDKIVEVEQHLAGCQRCCSYLQFSGAVRASVRQTVRSSVPSSGFQQRVMLALAAERARETEQARQPSIERGLPWRVVLPLGSAAAVTLMVASLNAPGSNPASAVPMNAAQPMSLAATMDQLIDELVSYHVRAPEPDVRELAAIQDLEPEVGVPLHVPNFKDYGVRWEGGGVVPLRNPGFQEPGWQTNRTVPSYQRVAASLRYRLGSHRITVYVYDASRFPLRARLEPRVVRDMPVYVGSRRGYSIAAAERRGVGYAAAADLGDQEIAELIASTAVQ